MKNHGRLLYALTGALILFLPPAAQAETMREAVESALLSHPSIDVAKARKAGAKEDESAQYSNLFPEISTTATGGRIFGNNSTTRGLNVSRGEAYSWLWEGSGSITQPIFDGFETYNRIDAARARETAADFDLADARETVALQAGQAYLNVMRAQEALAKTRSYQDKIQDYLDRINKMVDSGAADDSEAAQAKNIQSQLQNTEAEMEGQVKTALADYVESTGSMPHAELQKVDSQKNLLFSSVDEAIAYADSNHPMILSAKKAIEAEDDEVDADTGSMLPDLDGELSYLKRDQKEEIGGEVVDARAVMRMNWAFSTGGGQLAKIRKSKAERSEAIAKAAQTQRDVERDIRRAYAEYETAQKQQELNRNRAKVTQDLLDTYQKQFEGSKVRLLQLMQAENQVFTTDLERINSDYRVLMAELTTMASTGQLISAMNIDDTAAPVVQKVADVAKAPPASQIDPLVAPTQAKAESETPITPATDLEQSISQPAQGK